MLSISKTTHLGLASGSLLPPIVDVVRPNSSRHDNAADWLPRIPTLLLQRQMYTCEMKRLTIRAAPLASTAVRRWWGSMTVGGVSAVSTLPNVKQCKHMQIIGQWATSHDVPNRAPSVSMQRIQAGLSFLRYAANAGWTFLLVTASTSHAVYAGEVAPEIDAPPTSVVFGPMSTPNARRRLALRPTSPSRNKPPPSTTRKNRLLQLILAALLLLIAAASLRRSSPIVTRVWRRPLLMKAREVKKVVFAREQSEGVGARVRRSIGSVELRNLDPFLLLDEFHVTKPAGFPDHPHRGMQTVTYMLKGAFKHEDNKGHSGTIGVGDLQWMAAGRGIVHSEMPATDGDNVGLQLWVNLAASHKMSKPQYQELLASEVPEAKSKDGKISVKVIAGKCLGVDSAVFTVTPTMYWDVNFLSGTTFEEELPENYNSFLYVLEGKVFVGDKREEGVHGSCMVLGPGEGVRVTSDGPSRFVVLGGQPLNEPVVQHGPFVMNTREQIMQAFQDYQAGKF